MKNMFYDLKCVYTGDGGWTIGNEDWTILAEYSEQVLLIGGPKNQDVTDLIVNIKPGLTYISFPTGETDYEYTEGSIYSSHAKQKYGAFRGLYFNPSPFGLSMGNVPTSKDSKPAYEAGRRVMFWEDIEPIHAYWDYWIDRGNNLATNNAWKPGKNCVF